jgi:hypothetical protein
MPSQPIASTDTVRSLSLPVAQAMRELADRLSALCGETDQEKIYTLSTDLKGIGWNSLFVSSSLDRFLQVKWRRRVTTPDESRDEFSRQLDSLLVAAKYLDHSVKTLKELELAMPDCSNDHQDAYACLVEKLGAIIRECQRSAK